MLLFRLLALTLIALSAAAPSNANPSLPEDSSAAIILAYSRIGEDAHPESSLRIEQFKTHIKEIKHGDYHVLPLPTIVKALQERRPLPPHSIAITFEGGFRSAYTNAIPILLEHDIPFTIFFASSKTQTQSYLDWPTLKKLSRHKHVTLGILPDTYGHMTHLSGTEQIRQINIARAAFRKNLGTEAQYFAYPFGEISTSFRDIVKKQNFTAAFGLHSGVAHTTSDLTALPRFTMTDQFGDLSRFRTVTKALPFPIVDAEPQDPLITNEHPSIGFTVPDTLKTDLSRLACFISGQSRPHIEILGTRVEIRPQEALDTKRTRINCTLRGPPDENDTPRWRWLGFLLHNGL